MILSLNLVGLDDLILSLILILSLNLGCLDDLIFTLNLGGLDDLILSIDFGRLNSDFFVVVFKGVKYVLVGLIVGPT